MQKTTQIRKQPHRSSRRELRPYFRNPLSEVDQSSLALPQEIESMVKGAEYICLRNFESLAKPAKKSSIDILT